LLEFLKEVKRSWILWTK